MPRRSRVALVRASARELGPASALELARAPVSVRVQAREPASVRAQVPVPAWVVAPELVQAQEPEPP
jgi:hypothetical protein